MKITIIEAERTDILNAVAMTSLGTKVHPNLAEQLTEIVLKAVFAIKITS